MSLSRKELKREKVGNNVGMADDRRGVGKGMLVPMKLREGFGEDHEGHEM
jgi:hypothetical protein